MNTSHEVDYDAPSEELVECTLCHAHVALTRSAVLGGRRLCFACAETWFSEDGEPD